MAEFPIHRAVYSGDRSARERPVEDILRGMRVALFQRSAGRFELADESLGFFAVAIDRS